MSLSHAIRAFFGQSREGRTQQPNEDYHKWAQSLIEMHEHHQTSWYSENDRNYIVQDSMMAFVRGDTLGTNGDRHVHQAIDEFKIEMLYIDFLVDQAGLEHASGTEDCASWDPNTLSKRPDVDQKNIRSTANYLRAQTAGWGQTKSRPYLPYLYLAACAWDTMTSFGHLNDLIHTVDLADKKLYVLRLRDNLISAEIFGFSKRGRMDGPARVRALLDEMKQGKIDFNNFQLSYGEPMKEKFERPDGFWDCVFDVVVQKLVLRVIVDV
ncbi:hypothetical protein M426DRAFT_325082 [Hypoxylon sp. CI-4A]|nr:hypothetical protein M426DRAFT_325082 [Hypoxylon sp. CI-4A]